MTTTFDAIVLGLGGFGSAALLHLAQRGIRVLGIEQFSVAHDRGSSHGETRIIRKAYFEHPDYVPLLFRSYELWREMEAATGRSLYTECGLFLAGPPQGETIAGALESARLHGVMIDELSLPDAQRRFPLFRFDDGDAIVFEPEAGYLRVEDCVATHIEQAVSNGALIVTGETVNSWAVEGNSVRVITARQEYEASRLVITAGPWSRALLNAHSQCSVSTIVSSNCGERSQGINAGSRAVIAPPLTVRRKLMFWHEVSSIHWTEATAFFYERPAGRFYGFPSLDGRMMKVAEHTGGRIVDDPGTVDRGCDELDRTPVSQFVTQALRHVSPSPTRHAVCMYTMTPDGHFIVDRHPEYPQVVLAAGFSGHGFKFTPVIGEAIADLAIRGETALPIQFLRLDRPALQPQGITQCRMPSAE